jgi:DNA polymerase III subunit delta
MSSLPTAAQMRDGKLKPLYLLYGSEDFLLEEALTPFLSEVIDESMRAFNQDIFHAEDVKPEELFALCASFPMMSERRLVVLHSLEKASAKLLTDLGTYLEAPSPSTCLVMTAAKIDKRRKVWKTLLKQVPNQEFQPLRADRLPQFMQKRMESMGVELPNNQAGPLAEQLAGAPLRLVMSELDKLFLLTGEGGCVGPAEMAAAMGVDQDVSPFLLGESLLASDAKRSLIILKNLLLRDDAAFTILPLLHRQFGRLWFLKRLLDRRLSPNDIATQLGLNAWAVKKSLGAASRWSLSAIEEACALLLVSDAGLKGNSPLTRTQQLTELVIRLCRLN